MDRKQKLSLARAKTTPTPVEVGFFQSKDLEDIHTKFSSFQETIIKLISSLETIDDGKETVDKLESINNNLVTALSDLEKAAASKDEQFINAVSEISSNIVIPAFPDEVTIKNPGKLPRWLESPEAITKNLALVGDQIAGLAESLKPSQEPGSFTPYRRVKKQGNRLMFDDSDWSSTGGGGGGVQELGADHMDTGQISVTGAATGIVSARAGRRGVLITNLGAVDVYLGSTSGVLTTTGSLLLGTKGTAIFVPTTTAVYGITGGGTVSVSYIEVY